MPTINKKTCKQENIKWNTNRSIEFYNSPAWKTLRNNYKLHHPLCEECLNKGISKPAEHVHHKIPFLSGKDDNEKWSLLLDVNNLQSLCAYCHREKHKKVFGNKTYDY